MLVLTRRSGQSIRIGPNVEVRVVRIEGDRVVLGIAAPLALTRQITVAARRYAHPTSNQRGTQALP